MTHDASAEYLRNAVNTASPEQLHMMLLDGAVRFSKQAREAIEKRDYETSCDKLIRAQKIIVQLQNGLRPEVNRELCEQMASLYSFIYNRLVDANLAHEVKPIDDALVILHEQQDTWRIVIDKLKKENPGMAGVVGSTSAQVSENRPTPVSPPKGNTAPVRQAPASRRPEPVSGSSSDLGGSLCVEG